MRRPRRIFQKMQIPVSGEGVVDENVGKGQHKAAAMSVRARKTVEEATKLGGVRKFGEGAGNPKKEGERTGCFDVAELKREGQQCEGGASDNRGSRMEDRGAGLVGVEASILDGDEGVEARKTVEEATNLGGGRKIGGGADDPKKEDDGTGCFDGLQQQRDGEQSKRGASHYRGNRMEERGAGLDGVGEVASRAGCARDEAMQPISGDTQLYND